MEWGWQHGQYHPSSQKKWSSENISDLLQVSLQVPGGCARSPGLLPRVLPLELEGPPLSSTPSGRLSGEGLELGRTPGNVPVQTPYLGPTYMEMCSLPSEA